MKSEQSQQVGATWDAMGNVWRIMENGTFNLASLGFEYEGSWSLYVWDEEFGEFSDCPKKTAAFEKARAYFSGPVYSHGEVIGFRNRGKAYALWVPVEHTVGFPLGGE